MDRENCHNNHFDDDHAIFDTIKKTLKKSIEYETIGCSLDQDEPNPSKSFSILNENMDLLNNVFKSMQDDEKKLIESCPIIQLQSSATKEVIVDSSLFNGDIKTEDEKQRDLKKALKNIRSNTTKRLNNSNFRKERY